MSFNHTPSANRIHIGVFGRRNAGKSSLINAITGQDLSIVSDIKGTTTDPVLKSMELLPLGPVVLIDTPGLDDVGDLGSLRVSKAYQMLHKTDIALLVIDGMQGFTADDQNILNNIQEKKIPCLMVLNKCDGIPTLSESILHLQEIAKHAGLSPSAVLPVSAVSGEGIHQLKEAIGKALPSGSTDKCLIRDKINPLDFVVLVVPIDAAAPKGRLILPQQQTIRDLLEGQAVPVVCKDTELEATLTKLAVPPALVITDSQAFQKVAKIVPEKIPLTSFSILFARFKGNLKSLTAGASVIGTLQDGDRVLISEGCTHHRQCGDIGTDKIPRWLQERTGKDLKIEFTSGTGFPSDLTPYRLIIHCGGCMLNEKEMKYRLNCARDARIPMTNYGTAIAYMKGILPRSTAIFADELR